MEAHEQIMGEHGFLRKLQMFLFSILPYFISRPLLKKIALDKKFVVKNSGTVGVTALGMFGKNIGGWVLHFPTRTVDIALGGIKEKPAIIEGKVVPREILNITIYVDHNIVDGAPTARFSARVVELMQEPFGLDDL